MSINNVKEVLVFDVWCDYACFRQPYTTTSVLSYPFPSRTSIAGLVSAILGSSKNSYNEQLFNESNSKIGIRIFSNLDKLRLGLNLLDTKFGFRPQEIVRKGQQPRVQIPFEFFKDVKYRIYVWLNDEKQFNKLEDMLKRHECVYTPYLGLAFLIADFKFVGKFRLKAMEGCAYIDTIVPAAFQIEVEMDKKYGKISSVPLFMDNSRRVTKYGDFYIEWAGKPLLVKNAKYYNIKNVKDENIILL